MTYANGAYSAQSGKSTISGGRVVLPSWVPPSGFFADVPMTNYPKDVAPAVYAGLPGATRDPFIQFGGSAYLSDYSALGAQVYYSGGHESSATDVNFQMTMVCDFSTLTWSSHNSPNQQNTKASFDAAGTTGYSANDGSPYTPHTYSGLAELPAAWGGGPKGTLMSFFAAGSPYPNKINLFDVSQTKNGYSQLATTQSQNADPTKIRFSATGGDTGTYPFVVKDNTRQGWWALSSTAVDYTLFVSKSGAITQYPALGGNLSNGAMILCNSLNLLVALDGGYETGPNAGTSYRKLYIRNLTTGAMTQTTTSGTVPCLTDGYDGGKDFHRQDSIGLQWVDELGYAVGFDYEAVPPNIVKLTPPASNPDTTPWTWSVVPLQHWTAGDPIGIATLRTPANRMNGMLKWIPTLHAFTYCVDHDQKPQIIRL